MYFNIFYTKSNLWIVRLNYFSFCFFLVFALFTIHLACFVADREAGTCC